MAFRPLNGTDTIDFYNMVSYANSISDNILMPIVLLTIFLISLIGMALTGRGIARSLLYSSFICSILGILLAVMSMLNVQYVYLLFFLTGIGAIWTKLAEGMS